jgi:predicted CXXCH cytochrome family protein
MARAISGPDPQRYRARYTLSRRGHGATDHPVGVEYPQFGKGYRPMTSVLSSGVVTLPNGKVECTSCHDPHNEAEVDKMLVMSDDRSALCLTCHKK